MHNVSITAFGYFTANVSIKATTFFFVDADNASLVVYGDEGYCNTTTYQTINSISGPVCPPVKASAYLRTDIFLDDYWPEVSPIGLYQTEKMQW